MNQSNPNQPSKEEEVVPSTEVPAPKPSPEEAGPVPLATADYEQMLDDFSGFESLEDGEIIKGKVIAVTSTEVIVDVGYKSEGMIPLQEFLRTDGSVDIKPGDEIEVILERSEDLEGRVILSREKARRLKAWDQIEKAHNEQTVLTGLVLEKTKGGVFVDIGVKAFLPGSQIDVKPVRNLDALKGQQLECKVIKINKKRNNIVLSRRAVIEERETRRKSETLAQLAEGAILPGTVKNITDYGVFVDLGGIDGLLHISDITWGRPKHPSHYFDVGQEIRVKVLKFEPEKERVSLGYKQLNPDPWEEVPQRFPVGTKIKGTVISLTDYGAFIELEPGVEGLIHISEMTWSKRLKAPSKLLSLGNTTEAVVLELTPQERKISLGLKQTLPDPWDGIAERHPVGSVVTGRVRNLTEFGAFVEVEEGIDGLVHISDLSWSRHLKHPSEVVRKGEQVQAVVLHIDPAQRRMSLGLKQLRPNIWDDFFQHHQVGDLISGTIVRFASFGAFVELAEGIEGLCHISEFDEEMTEMAKRGEGAGLLHQFRIIRLLPQEKRIGLSMWNAQAESPEPVAPEQAQAAAAGVMTETAGLSSPLAAEPLPETSVAEKDGAQDQHE